MKRLSQQKIALKLDEGQNSNFQGIIVLGPLCLRHVAIHFARTKEIKWYLEKSCLERNSKKLTTI